MSTRPIPQAVVDLVTVLASGSPAPESIWLIGSRANCRHRPDSDTDLLVFGSKAFLMAATKAISDTPAVDVLVVYDGERFEDVLAEKRGSLTSWKWRLIGDSDAAYMGGKFVPDTKLSDGMLDLMRSNPNLTLGEFVEYEERAVKVWPR